MHETVARVSISHRNRKNYLDHFFKIILTNTYEIITGTRFLIKIVNH